MINRERGMIMITDQQLNWAVPLVITVMTLVLSACVGKALSIMFPPRKGSMCQCPACKDYDSQGDQGE
jgi:hypothetical protein